MAAALARVASYWSLLGLSIQTSRWEQAMNRNLLEMSASLEQAAALQASASGHEAAAAQNQAWAASHEAEAAELQEEAAILLKESRSEAGVAEADREAVAELEGKIELEQGEAAAHASLAAAEEAASDSGAAEAIADATEAARIEARAHGEEIGIAFCELVPVLDVACDFVGGVTAVGLEAGAAAEALKATSELAASAASKSEEEREMALAGELEGQVAEDGAVVDKIELDALERESRSKAEQLLAQEKEAAAQGLVEKAEEEEALGVEEETVATSDEAESAAQTSKALARGGVALWNGVMASICGIVSLSFFLFRSCTNFLIPAARQTIAGMAKIKNPGDLIGAPALCHTSDASYLFHHCAIFFVVASTYQGLLAGLTDNSARARGGIILCFAMTCGFVQAFCLHLVPNGVAKAEQSWKLLLHFVRRMLVLPILFTLEILIVWVVLGGKVFLQLDLPRIFILFFWISLALSVSTHIWLLEIPRLQRRNTEPAGVVVDDTDSKASKQEKEPSEIDSLLVSKENRHSLLPPEQVTWQSELLGDLQSLQLPLEILILACLFVCIVHSVTATRFLWPISKEVWIRARPEWFLPVAIVIAVVLLGLGILSVWCG